MKDDFKKIISGHTENTDQEKLLKYLDGKLDDAEMHEIEKAMLDNEFESEALEGLEQVKDKAEIMQVVENLNRDLKKWVAKKAKDRQKMKLQPQWWLYFSVLIFLLILVLVYMYLHVKVNS